MTPEQMQEVQDWHARGMAAAPNAPSVRYTQWLLDEVARLRAALPTRDELAMTRLCVLAAVGDNALCYSDHKRTAPAVARRALARVWRAHATG